MVMTTTIRLASGEIAIVDEQDYELLSRRAWRISSNGFAITATPRRGGKQQTVYMHRLIMNPPQGMTVDHINHDKLDNQRSNLRIATYAENNQNRRNKRGSRSQYKGVYWDVSTKLWCVSITANKERFYIGSFHDEIDAAKAHDVAALYHHGEFACLNFPEECKTTFEMAQRRRDLELKAMPVKPAYVRRQRVKEAW